MNIFASFAQSLKLALSRSAHVQGIGSNLPTLTLILNSPLPNKSLTHRKVLDRMDRGDGRWIELLDHSFGEEPLYRACGQNGALCRYTNDLWQAEIYVQYY